MWPVSPKPLHPGSRIAIISPATTVRGEYVDGAADFLRSRGYEPVISAHAKGPADGSFASSLADRLEDFRSAWTDPEIEAVLCARGGYGSAHLLPHLDPAMLRSNAKWLIGFSDISALHAALLHAGVQSVHGPMAKHLTEDPDHPSTQALMALLSGEEMNYEFGETHRYNRPGEAEGILAGGNLAVLNGLAATPYDIFRIAGEQDMILFIEDISEAIYAVERMLVRLYMAGTLHRLRGLIVGRFTEYRADLNHEDMETMIHRLLERIGVSGIPVAFDWPCGHVRENYPLIEGVRARLEVGRTVKLQSKPLDVGSLH